MFKQIIKTGIVIALFILTIIGINALEKYTEQQRINRLQTEWVAVGVELHSIEKQNRDISQ